MTQRLVQRMVQGKLSARELPVAVSVWELKAAYNELREKTKREEVEFGACILSTEHLLLDHEVRGTASYVGPIDDCCNGDEYVGFAHTHLPDPVTGRFYLGFSAADYRGTLVDGDKLALVTAGDEVYALVRISNCTLLRNAKLDVLSWHGLYHAALNGELAASGAINEALWKVNQQICEVTGLAFYRGRFGEPLRLAYLPRRCKP